MVVKDQDINVCPPRSNAHEEEPWSRDGEDDVDGGDDDLMHLTTMPMEQSPGCCHKQGGRDDQERQGGGHQRHQAGN